MHCVSCTAGDGTDERPVCFPGRRGSVSALCLSCDRESVTLPLELAPLRRQSLVAAAFPYGRPTGVEVSLKLGYTQS